MKKFVLAFLILAIAVAFAGTVPSSHSYTITLLKSITLAGTQLVPGDYRLTVAPDKITLVKDKVNLQVPGKIETATQKFDDTVLVYAGDKLAEIRLGGTKTKVVIAQ